jgi:carbonic anhydrase/acetyltransferase-like protein (isoleucine patch superfamily)
VSVRSGGAVYMQMQAIDASVWIAPTAQIFGRVAIGAGSSVWHNAVMRAECQEIRIGRMTNLQDFSMVHVGYDDATTIGDFCSIAHHATVHGCTLGDAVLVGVGAVIMDGAVSEQARSSRGAVRPGPRFPGSVSPACPQKNRRRDAARANRMNAWLYHRNAQFYREGRHRAWDGPEFEAWRRAQAEVEADCDSGHSPAAADTGPGIAAREGSSARGSLDAAGSEASPSALRADLADARAAASPGGSQAALADLA